jgi:DNA-binding ferritin-like protein
MKLQLVKKSQDLMKSYESGLMESLEEKEVDGKSIETLTKYLGLLRSLETYYHHAHWVTKGDNYYGDHLLFERLYGETKSQVDDLAEKMVGVFGEDSISIQKVTEVVMKVVSSSPKMDKKITGFELAKYGLGLERIFLQMTNNLYNKMKKDGTMTMGFDDLLMSMYSEHEKSIYLLQQRTKRLE